MGSPKRIEFYGAIYHIIHRGNNKGFIFEDSEEKMELLKIIGEVKEIFDFQLIAYVIMGNHYHLVIRTFNIPISQIMHRINTRYAKYYNRRKERTGSPFEGRYKSILVQNQSYFLELVRYIHNNPVYANISTSMCRYQWSSDVFYRMNIGNLIYIDELLESLSSDRQKAIEKYKEFMNRTPEAYERVKGELEEEDIIGSEDFKESFMDDDRIERAKILNKILQSTCPGQVEYNLIKKGSRQRYLIKYKKDYAEEALSQGYSMVDIAENISVTPWAIRKILQ